MPVNPVERLMQILMGQPEGYRGMGSVTEPTDQQYGQATFNRGPVKRPSNTPVPTPQPTPQATPTPDDGAVPGWALGNPSWERKPKGYTWEEWREICMAGLS